MDLDGITLPDSLSWADEFDWSPITQSTGHGVTGALFIQEGVKAKGREITLTGTEELGLITRSVVESLITKRDTTLWTGVLTLPDARTFTVAFRNGDKAVDVSPVIAHNQYVSSGLYKVNAIRLMEVA